MKYKPNYNRIPNPDHVKSDRNEVRRRTRAVKKFGSTVGEKYWWSTLSDNERWEVYVDWCYFLNTVNRNPNTESFRNFILNAKSKYKGDINMIRDMKIDDILNILD